MKSYNLSATDWEVGVDYDRMRKYRLNRAKQSLKENSFQNGEYSVPN